MKEPCAGEVRQSVGGLMMAGLMLALFTAALDSPWWQRHFQRFRLPLVGWRIMPGL